MNFTRLRALASMLYHEDRRRKQKQMPRYYQPSYTHPCGTPACAFGTWAANNPERFTFIDRQIPLLQLPGDVRLHGMEAAMKEFGLSYKHVDELFSSTGCNRAKTARQASLYIKGFIARHQKTKRRNPLRR